MSLFIKMLSRIDSNQNDRFMVATYWIPVHLSFSVDYIHICTIIIYIESVESLSSIIQMCTLLYCIKLLQSWMLVSTYFSGKIPSRTSVTISNNGTKQYRHIIDIIRLGKINNQFYHRIHQPTHHIKFTFLQRANRKWQMHGGSKGGDFPVSLQFGLNSNMKFRDSRHHFYRESVRVPTQLRNVGDEMG